MQDRYTIKICEQSDERFSRYQLKCITSYTVFLISDGLIPAYIFLIWENSSLWRPNVFFTGWYIENRSSNHSKNTDGKLEKVARRSRTSFISGEVNCGIHNLRKTVILLEAFGSPYIKNFTQLADGRILQWSLTNRELSWCVVKQWSRTTKQEHSSMQDRTMRKRSWMPRLGISSLLRAYN